LTFPPIEAIIYTMIKKMLFCAILTGLFVHSFGQAANLMYICQEGDIRYYHTEVQTDVVTRIDDNVSRGLKLPKVETTLTDVKQTSTTLCTLPGDAVMHELKQLKRELAVEIDGQAAPAPPQDDRSIYPWLAPVTIGMTPQGEIIGVYGTSQAVAARAKPEPSPELQELQLTEDLKKAYSMLYPVFPVKLVVPGESWTNVLQEISLPGLSPKPLDLVFTYTYVGDERLAGSKCGVIKVKLHIDDQEFAPDEPAKVSFSPAQGIEGIPTFLRLKSHKGKIYFDYREGRIRKASASTVLILGLDVPAGGAQIFGYTAVVTTTLDSTTEMKLEP